MMHSEKKKAHSACVQLVPGLGSSKHNTTMEKWYQ